MSGAGMRELEAFIARVESLATINAEVAAEAAEPVADVVRENVGKAVTPDGEAWPERKEGGKALQSAGDGLSSSSRGNKITLSLAPPYAFHNWGAGGSSTTKDAAYQRKRTAARQASAGTRSKFHAPKRQILPVAGEPIPPAMNEAIAEAARAVFGKKMEGR